MRPRRARRMVGCSPPTLLRPRVARAQKIIRLHPPPLLREQRSNRGVVPSSISLSALVLAGARWHISWCRRGRTFSCWNVAAIREGSEAACETWRTRASYRRGPGGFDDGWLQRYCTSTVMVWVAATSAWSFVAPVTVIWCVPLARPLNAPVKPF